MNWNWELEDWPHFRFEVAEMNDLERSFLKQGGMIAGALKHCLPATANDAMTEIFVGDSITTSAIEGETLDRASVRSSVLNQLGLGASSRKARPLEHGTPALLMASLKDLDAPLDHDLLFGWHRTLMKDTEPPDRLGTYRTGPMQIVSGLIDRATVHFAAPPADRVHQEMDRFFNWFNDPETLAHPLARAAIAHLHFESIHPFEDGNGRIGRALSERSLSQGIGNLAPTMLASEIESRRSQYYAEIELASQSMQVSRWVRWFADVVVAGQRRSLAWLEFIAGKAQLLDRLRGLLGPRQERCLLRMLEEGPAGFKGGLSSGNYQKITGASPATAGRDLAELVQLGALSVTGAGKGTRYQLVVPRDGASFDSIKMD